MKKLAYLSIILIDVYAALHTCNPETAAKSIVIIIIAVAFNMLFDFLNRKFKRLI